MKVCCHVLLRIWFVGHTNCQTADVFGHVSTFSVDLGELAGRKMIKVVTKGDNWHKCSVRRVWRASVNILFNRRIIEGCSRQSRLEETICMSSFQSSVVKGEYLNPSENPPWNQGNASAGCPTATRQRWSVTVIHQNVHMKLSPFG